MGKVLLLALCTTAPPLAPAFGQTSALEAEAERLLDAVRANPADMDLAFAYAEVAIALGDFEAAIGTLERMLITTPDLPRVRLELGSLYFRLGAYDVARVYLLQVLETPELPAAVERRVREMLRVTERERARHRFAGSLFVGSRYQSNANAGPSGARIDLGGIEVILDDQVTGNADVNAFALLGGTYVYDWFNQTGDTLVANGVVYGALYADQRALDLAVVELDVGPRLELAPRGLPGTSVRPFVAGALIGLDRAVYATSLGGGVTLSLRPAERASVDLTYDVRREDFRRSVDQPLADERDATRQAGLVVLRYALTPRLLAEATALAADSDAREGFRSFTDLAAGAALSWRFDHPIGREGPPWYVGVSGGVRRVDYAAPDPLLTPDTTRRDDEWGAGLWLAAGLTDALSMVSRVDYRDVSSNVALYSFDNLAVSLGLQWRF